MQLFKEVLRKHTIVPFTQRQAKEDVDINGELSVYLYLVAMLILMFCVSRRCLRKFLLTSTF